MKKKLSKKHFVQMTNEQLAKELAAYWLASSLYKLPTYLTELLIEASGRIKMYDIKNAPDFDEAGLS